MSKPGCEAASSTTSHVLEHVDDPAKRERLLSKALDDFRSGRPLADVARDLGFWSDSDIAFVENLPQDTHDEIHATILSYIDRDRPMTVLIDHEPAESFAVAVREHDDGRTVTITLHAPHH